MVATLALCNVVERAALGRANVEKLGSQESRNS